MLRVFVPNARPFFGRVESVRGLGAMAVALYHISGWMLNGQTVMPPGTGPLIPAHAALMAFFVISGFVLRGALEYGPQSPLPATTKFVISRFFRAIPIVAFGVLLTALSSVCHSGPLPALSTLQWLENMLLLDVSLNSTLWALQLEMLMVPVLLVLYFAECRWGPRLLLLVAVVTTGLAFLPRWAVWQPLSANLFSFVLGMLVPTLGQQMAVSASIRNANALSVLTILTMCLTGPLLGTFSLYSTILEANAAFVLISLIAYRSDLILSKVLNLSGLQWIGTASGSLYVLHMATIPPTMLLAQTLNLAAWMVVPVWIALLVPFSRLTYRLIESPGIMAGKSVTGWVTQKPLTTGTTEFPLKKAA